MLQALTISQPYASLIADGRKWVENRTWPTSHRGALAIHAGKGTQYLTTSQLASYPTSCLVAVAWVCDCVPIDLLRRSAEKATGDTLQRIQRILAHEHTEGPYCWILQRILKLNRPVDVGGARGIWTVPDDVAAEARAVGYEVKYEDL